MAPPTLPPTPTLRPSASLLLLSPTNRLLLLQRPATQTFPSAHVFPGGVLSPSDPAATHCALRETFEETGILLTTTPPPPQTDLAAIQRRVDSRDLDLFAWVSSWGGSFPRLRPFTTWITPSPNKHRFRAEMFVAELPAWIDEDAPVVGGEEAVGQPVWVGAEEALRMVRGKEIRVFPPQLYLIDRVARLLKEGGRERVLEWAEGEGARAVCEPVREKVEKGRWVIGLGERGDREVVVMVEVGDGEVRAVEIVDRETAARL